jgi:hypothetical protein
MKIYLNALFFFHKCTLFAREQNNNSYKRDNIKENFHSIRKNEFFKKNCNFFSIIKKCSKSIMSRLGRLERF